MTNARALLGIYLNDHLAGSVGALRVARRCLSRNPDGELGTVLRRFIAEAEEDRASLQQIMRRFGVRPSFAKQVAVTIAEVLGRRVKLNGRLVGYSDLSRLEELEILCLGVQGKAALWRTLESIAPTAQELLRPQLTELRSRAERQLEALEEQRLAAARIAFGDVDSRARVQSIASA